MIVIDLFADVTPIWKSSSQFYGTPYLWCMLHNFGGNIEMYGTLDAVASGPVDARLSENSTMVGVGMCMEGIEQNPVVYELMSEMAFRSDKVNLEECLKTYSSRRYGKAVGEVEEAWEILHRTVYNCTDSIADHNIDFIVKLPDWDPSLRTTSDKITKQMPSLFSPHKRRFSYHETTNPLPQSHLWYPTQDVIKALRLFLDAKQALAGSLTYRHDLVDLTRQVLSKYANQVYLDAINAFRVNDTKKFNYQSQKFLQLIKDTEELLAADDNFLLGTWLESAKNLAMNHKERKQYEWNARTQVTMWFDSTKTVQSSLHDYANKFWSALLGNYYLARASLYFDHLSRSLTGNNDFKLKEWRREWIAYSNKWQRSDELYSVKGKGDTLAISSVLYEKYLIETR